MTAQVQKILNELPDDYSAEDVQYRLYVAQTIQRREAQVARGETLSHEAVQERMQKCGC